MTDPAGRTGVRSTGIIFLVLFLDLIGFSIVFPLFAEMLKFYGGQHGGLLSQGMDALQALLPGTDPGQRAALFGGVMGGLYAGLQFIAAPWWGRLSDRIGRRPVILWSLTGSVVAYGMWIFAGDFSVFVISRIIAGVMSGNVSAANAAMADITTPETRGKGMAFVGMAFGLGFICGPALGGLTSHLTFSSTAYGLNPFSVPALIAFSLCLFNLVWAYLKFAETLPPERRGKAEVARTINPLAMFSRELGADVPRINGAFLLHTAIFSAMESTLVFLAAHQCGFTPMDAGYLFAGMGLASAMIQGGVFRRLVTRLGPRTLTLWGLLSLVPGLILVGLVGWIPSSGLLIAGVLTLAIGTGLVFPGLSTLVSLGADPRHQGWVMGSFRSAGALGRAIGPLFGAVVYFAIAPGAPYLLGALAIISPWLLVRGLPLHRAPSDERTAAS